MRKPISGTKAAKMLGLGNNLSFTKKFVETRQIQAIVFPGAKRKLYDPDDVERLVFINKQAVVPNAAGNNIREIIERHKRKYNNSNQL